MRKGEIRRRRRCVEFYDASNLKELSRAGKSPIPEPSGLDCRVGSRLLRPNHGAGARIPSGDTETIPIASHVSYYDLVLDHQNSPGRLRFRRTPVSCSRCIGRAARTLISRNLLSVLARVNARRRLSICVNAQAGHNSIVDLLRPNMRFPSVGEDCQETARAFNIALPHSAPRPG